VTRVVLFGARGRMGVLAAEEIASAEDFTLVAGVEREHHPELGPTSSGVPIIADGQPLPEADVWLDFSLAAPATLHAARAADLGMALVIAATGFSVAHAEQIQWYAKRCPLLLAPNLSAGVGAFENLAVSATRLLPDGFTSAMVETHHLTKKDAPSGTAIRIADRMAQFGERPEIHSIRGGGIPGEHRIHFIGADEELVLIHRAWSRRAFASGILRALRFIVRQPTGCYSVQDIYGLD